MSNRLVSLLILVLTFWALYLFYYYFFVLNKWTLTLNWNVWEYTVQMYNDKLKTSFETYCINQKCELIDLAPFDYKITISKNWYKNFIKDIKILKKTNILIDFSLEKQLELKQINKEEDLQKENSQLDKFREIAELQKKYKYINIDDLGYFYFEDNGDDTITLYNKINDDIKNLYTFTKIERNLIDIQKLYQTNKSIFISYWDEKYFYNLDDNNILKVFFPQNINYVKVDENIYSFVNEKWTFLYDLNTQKIEYFYLFKDFINYDSENYLWIIFDNEAEKKKNHNLENRSWNLIVKYNFKTKAIKILETTQLNISKILFEENKIYFYDDLGNKYLIDNIE